MIFMLIMIGFLVGILSGFFGFGGGFIITPFLFALGFSMNVAVGTSIAQILGTAVIATMRHKSLRHVDVKLGLLMVIGAFAGVEIGAQIIERLKAISPETVDVAVSLVYIILLGLISAFMSMEAWSSRREESSRRGLHEKAQRIRVPPVISLSESGVASISLWLIISLGFATGLTAGFVGAGGGFLQIPLLIYLIGCRTTVAVGTNLFSMLIASAYACFSHALKGNVDVFSAAYMLIGSSVGAQIGALATRYVREEDLRLYFGVCVGFISISVAFELLSKLTRITLFGYISLGMIILTTLSLSSLIMIRALRRSKRRTIE